jgi:phosphoglycolate phosphatase
MQTKYRAVLFDLDGTLADTLRDLAQATNHALASLGCPIHPTEAYRYLVGDGARTLCSRALPPNRQDLIDQALSLMRAHYHEHRYDLTRLYDGIPELIAALHQHGLRQGVLSNKPDDFTREMIAHYFPSGSFDIVRGHRPNTPLKPDPSVAIQIAREVGVPTAQWIYLGDTNTDMRTARAAGMFAVGVLWGFRDREELLASGAQALVTRPDEVLKLL